MAGFTDILGALVKSGMSGSSTTRMRNAFGAGEGGLNDIVGSIGKMLGGAGQPQLGDLSAMLGDVLGSVGKNKVALGGLAALGGALLGGGRASAKGAVGGGALAMLASLAYSALKNSDQEPARPPNAIFEPETEEQKQELESEANILVKAMINAAKADGDIDQAELKRIIGKFEEDGISQEDKDLFMAESSKPFDLKRVIKSASGQPEIASQIYAASLLAIEVDTLQEEQYMEQLASGLGLSSATVVYIEKSLAK